jgi:uncharacterized protein (DUF58 family)
VSASPVRPSWRRRIADWLEPPRKLRPTRTGWSFLAGVLAVGAAAVNTGNNLLYFVLGMMLGAIVVSGILSERNLRNLEIERELPEGVFARTPSALAYRIRSRRGFLPALGLEIRDRAGDGTLGNPVKALRIDPGQSRRRPYERTFERRGVVKIPEIELATTFPFGLFRKSRRKDCESEVRVRPRVPEIDLPDALGGQEEGRAPALARGEGLDLFGLRDHARGDEARRIHWKATARVGRTIVKDPARDQPPTVVIELSGRASAGDPLWEQALERAAGIASVLVREGWAVGLAAGSRTIAPGEGPAALSAILDALVDVEAHLDGPPEVELPSHVARVRVEAA